MRKSVTYEKMTDNLVKVSVDPIQPPYKCTVIPPY